MVLAKVIRSSAIAAFLVAASCISSENAGRNEESADSRTDDVNGGAAGGSVYVDTVSPVAYEIFEQVLDSEHPKKVSFRLMTLEKADWEAWGRTLRLALDSLVNADPDVVAARATLYEVVPLEPPRGRLVPKAWSEWIPNEGFDGAGPDSREDLHRIYVYYEHPGWAVKSKEQ